MIDKTNEYKLDVTRFGRSYVAYYTTKAEALRIFDRLDNSCEALELTYNGKVIAEKKLN